MVAQQLTGIVIFDSQASLA